MFLTLFVKDFIHFNYNTQFYLHNAIVANAITLFYIQMQISSRVLLLKVSFTFFTVRQLYDGSLY